jgi:hypothetical protein
MKSEVSVLAALREIPTWMKVVSVVHVIGLLGSVYLLSEPVLRYAGAAQ